MNEISNLTREKLESLSLSLGKYLKTYQVNCSEMLLASSNENELVFSCRPFFEAPTVSWSFKNINGRWHYATGNDWKIVPLNGPFRLPVMGQKFKRILTPLKEPSRSLSKKVTQYFKREKLFLRIRGYLSDRVTLAQLENRINYTQINSDRELAKNGGITFIAQERSPSVLILKCLDNGGIYDVSLNDEATQWPDQVPAAYYSTEYAAYGFYSLWKITGESEWRTACADALKFFEVNHIPKISLVFDHYEFKVLPIAALLERIISAGEVELFPKFDIKKYLNDKWMTYQPVNVHALRIANYSVLKKLGLPYSKRKFKESCRKIKKHQSTQGLIQDNTGGASVSCADLTYHQFSTACLSFALQNFDNAEINEHVSSALSFSRYIKQPDGHVAYFGRGANNIYHLASYIFSESCSKSTDFESINKILKIFEKYRNDKGGYPTALNSYSEQRMGWNHCSVPYNGQVLFFLCRSLETLHGQFSKIQHEEKIFERVQDFDYLKLESRFITSVIGRGADTFKWSGGSHLIGMGGLCSLSIANLHVSLAADYSVKDQFWTSDLPWFDDGDVANRNFRGRLVASDNSVYWESNGIKAKYTLDMDRLVVLYTLPSKISGEAILGGLTFNESVIDTFDLPDQTTLTLKLKNNAALTFQIIDTSSSLIISSSEIKSNPFGKGMSFRLKKRDEAQVTPSTFGWQIKVRT